MISVVSSGHVPNSCVPRPVEGALAEPRNHSTRDALTMMCYQNKKLSDRGAVKRKTHKQSLLKSELGPTHSTL